jgi:hypothetical protein
MGEEVGTMQFRVQGEQIRKYGRKKKRKKEIRKKTTYAKRIYICDFVKIK